MFCGDNLQLRDFHQFILYQEASLHIPKKSFEIPWKYITQHAT